MPLADFLSPYDRAKLARNLGVQVPDGSGRVYRNGVVVSAGDAANTAATGAVNNAYAAQGGQYGNSSNPVNAQQIGQNAYNQYYRDNTPQPSQNFIQPPAQPMRTGGQVTPAPVAPSASADMLNRATLQAQAYDAAQQAQPAPITPAPYNPNATATFTLPDGTTRQYGGQTSIPMKPAVPFPTPSGYGFPENPATPAQQSAAQPSLGFLNPSRPLTAQEINSYGPEGRAAAVQKCLPSQARPF